MLWDREDLLGRLEEFSKIYEERPIKNNQGGMKSPCLFMLWFALSHLKPCTVIESGVLRGQGTWCIWRACPEAQVYCLDRSFVGLKFKLPGAVYQRRDFGTIDWSDVSGSSLVFFDDHQNAYKRLEVAHQWGLRDLMFEDNYPSGHGDCYSIKKAIADNQDLSLVESYYEFPPIFPTDRTIDAPTPEPLFLEPETSYQECFWTERNNYTWMCYVRLRE